MAPNPQQFLRLVDSYSRQRQTITDRLEAQVDSIWSRVDPYKGAEVKEFVEQATMFTTAAQQQVIYLATATQRQALNLMGVNDMDDYVPNVPDEVRMYSEAEVYEFARPVTRRTDQGPSNRLPADEVFNRPARQYRALRKEGKSHKESLDATRNRVKVIVGTNLALAQREAETQVIQASTRKSKSKNKPIGYRRIIHPERSKSGIVCGLCVAAASRTYTIEDLQPLHDHCNCTILPVTAEMDPGLDLNEQDLKNLYGPDGKTAAEYLLTLSYKVEQHGELGPILVPEKGAGGIIHFNQNSPTAEQAEAA
ncbi:head maturation protease [Gordonia phage OneUp]|uniref:Capsid maturation protease n=1 Tax=Gordonia phage OneUp TaxID=1838074 RepID=A0A160DES1_9CAUD|nr:head maturation protease [Gordonia phage OneUp]ANA86361.1 capsid maturation protease [Gordonia phage OneUp]